MKNLPCIVRTLRTNSKRVIILVDSGSTNNYIRKDLLIGNRIKLNHHTTATTLHGSSVIQFKQEIPLLKQKLEFLEMDKLTDFDMILGERSLRKMKARIHSKKKHRYKSTNDKLHER